MSLLDFLLGNIVFQIIGAVVVAFFLVFDIALAWWVYRDAVMRTNDRPMQIFATVMTLIFNVFAVVLYSLLRPMQTLAEKEIERLELSILSAEAKETEGEKKEKEKEETNNKKAKRPNV